LTKTQRMHIGLDDTDSTRKGCTTYLAALLVEKLEKLHVRFLDYPNLIRLNPNVPWKTRGNGALCLRIEYEESLEDQIKRDVINLVEQHADLTFKGTDPGIAFLKKTEIPEEIKKFAKRAATKIVTLKEALKLIKRFEGEALGFNTRRGIIGALAAIGENLTEDHTYELIAYRLPENYGLTRRVDEASIFEMDRVTQPYTFNNVDEEKGRVIITPRGPDPILFGIRGETPEIVKKAFGHVTPMEPIERWVIFRTNQGTDAHLTPIDALSQIKPHSAFIATGVVSQNPRIVPLRHVIFSIKDETKEVDCAAYEPTGTLRKVARELTTGDWVEVYGAVREPTKDRPLTINLEKIKVLQLAQKTKYRNAFCPKCCKRLKSMGTNKGFRCEKCGTRYRKAEKISLAEERKLKTGLYLTSTRSQRHLTKPLRRYGLEKPPGEKILLTESWHSPPPTS
jgi:tRNA(Ile2)-agmatinylcytidine synthase